MKPTVYEINAFLLIDPALTGQLSRLEYLPTERSRKWRASSLTMRYSEVAVQTGIDLVAANGWAGARWVKA